MGRDPTGSVTWQILPILKTDTSCPEPTDVKQQAHELIDSLDDTATWDEVSNHMEVRVSIEQGLADVKACRVHTQEELRKRFGLDD